jgi:hypothetical protein
MDDGASLLAGKTKGRKAERGQEMIKTNEAKS